MDFQIGGDFTTLGEETQKDSVTHPGKPDLA
jgi:hypothetical protein